MCKRALAIAVYGVWGMFALTPYVVSQDLDHLSLIEDASGMFNERGYLKSNSFSLDGEEIINDFNGNLIWSKRLKYLPVSQNGMAMDLQISYNGSVGHTVRGRVDPSDPENCGLRSFNWPEWIISVNNVAIQTFNFENEFVSFNTVADTTRDADIAALINGYHSCYMRVPTSTGDYYGQISILLGDGSIRQFYSTYPKSNETGIFKGEYRTFSKDDRSKGFVDSLNNFTMFLENGTRVVFEHYVPDWRHEPDGHPVYDYPQIYLPKRFLDVGGRGFTIVYTNTVEGCPYGRPMVEAIQCGDWIGFDWCVSSYGGISQLRLFYNPEGFYEILHDYEAWYRFDLSSRTPGTLPSRCEDVNRGYIMRITDPVYKKTEFTYEPYTRLGLNFADYCVVVYGIDSSVTVDGAFKAIPWRITAIDYPTGSRTEFDYYEPDDNDVDYGLFCADIGEWYPCRKSDDFDDIGRDPFFINMVTNRYSVDASDDTVSSESFSYSWQEYEYGHMGYLDLEDRFTTQRTITDLATAETKYCRFVYRYYTENAPFSYDTRDRGWALKLLNTYEGYRDDFLDLPALSDYLYETRNYWNYVTLLLDSTVSIKDGVASRVSYNRTFVADASYPQRQSNILREITTDAFGKRTDVTYNDDYFGILNGDSYYNNINADIVRVRNANGLLVEQSDNVYYSQSSAHGYPGQLWLRRDYFITNGVAGSYVTNQYQYYKDIENVHCLNAQGALRKHIAPTGDSTVYHYCTIDTLFAPTTMVLLKGGETTLIAVDPDSIQWAPNPVTYYQLNTAGEVDTFETHWSAPVHQVHYRAVKYNGPDSLEYHQLTDNQGKPVLLVEPNRYASLANYEKLDRVEGIALPGDFYPVDLVGHVDTITIDTVPTWDGSPDDDDADTLRTYCKSIYNTETWTYRLTRKDVQFSFADQGLLLLDPDEIDSARFTVYCKGYSPPYFDDLWVYNYVYTSTDTAYGCLAMVPLSIGYNTYNVTQIVRDWANGYPNDTTQSIFLRVMDFLPVDGPEPPDTVMTDDFITYTSDAVFYSVDHPDEAKRPRLEIFITDPHCLEADPTQSYVYDDVISDYDEIDVTVYTRKYFDDTLRITRTAFDDFGRPARTDFIGADGSYNSVRTEYDGFGRVATTRDQLGYGTSQRYDDLDRNIRTTYPDPGASSTTAYYFGADASTLGFPSGFLFPDSSLYGVKYTDENGHFIHEYTDLMGRLRLKRQYEGDTVLNTYFNYDDLGNLTRIVRPEGDEIGYRYNSLGWLVEEWAADYDTVKYTYWSDGKVRRKQDGNLRQLDNGDTTNWILYYYDGLGRPTEERHISLANSVESTVKSLTRFYYDQGSSSNSKGRLSVSLSWLDQYGEQYDYDARGRLIRQKNIFYPWTDLDDSGNVVLRYTYRDCEHVIQYEYNHADLVTKIVYPDGMTITYDYDDHGRLETVGNANSPDKFASFEYTPRDEIERMTLGEGIQDVDYTYNARGWLTAINDGVSVGDTPGDLFGQKLYYYSHEYYFPQGCTPQYNGNVIGQAISIAGDPSTANLYKYDNLDRLTAVYEKDNPVQTEIFTYDKNGNRDTYIQDTVLSLYKYASGGNQLDSIISDNQMLIHGLRYDANGNVVYDGSRRCALSYDCLGRLAQVVLYVEDDTLEFRYGPGGERVVKRYIYHYLGVCPEEEYHPTPSRPSSKQPDTLADGPSPYEWCELLDTVETHYVRGLGAKVLAEYELDGEGDYVLRRKYIYAGDQRIAMVDADDRVFYYLNDHLGSARVVFRDQVTPTTDRVADKYHRYWAFGEDAGFTIETDQPFRFTGKPFDNEGGLGLYYYGARYYDPKTGRFISVDPARGKYPGLSPFIYCANNPLKYVDPDGRILWLLVAAAIVIAFDEYANAPTHEGDVYEKTSGERFQDGLEAVGYVTSAGAGKELLRCGARTLDQAFRPSASSRAQQIHGAVSEATQNRTTIAVTETKEGTRVVSSSEARLRAEQRSMLKNGEIEGIGEGHAEMTGVETAKKAGLTPTATAASRPVCPDCAKTLQRLNVNVLTPIKNVPME